VFAALLPGCVLASRAWPQASGGGRRRIGVLAPSTHAKEELTLAPFFAKMRELGWIEGRNVEYLHAYGDDRQELLAGRAAELVALRPELIFAPPGSAAVAAHHASATIPIVFASGVDPVRAGLVKSLARPGTNVTGITSIADSLAPKRVQLLREVLPRARRIGLLGTPTDPSDQASTQALMAVVNQFGLTLLRAEATTPAEFDAAVAQLIAQNADALMTESTLAFNLRDRLVELTNRRRLPVIAHRSQIAEAGALLAYGPSLDGQLRLAAQVVDKVLNGTHVGDIPVQQPNQFELVINLRTARNLGIELPASLRLRADRVIE
jgi:putative ABC transport system substrate-binding protein